LQYESVLFPCGRFISANSARQHMLSRQWGLCAITINAPSNFAMREFQREFSQSNRGQ
jgi:hypothetical protein